MGRTNHRAIDFGAIINAAPAQLEGLLGHILPDGQRRGDEWIALNPTRTDNRPGSIKVNVRTGVWSDSATGDSGGDIIKLYSYLTGFTQAEAALAIADRLGLNLGANAIGQIRSAADDWKLICPVPADAPALPDDLVLGYAPAGFRLSTRYPYVTKGGELLGVLARYEAEPDESGKPRKEFRFFTFRKARGGRRDWMCKGFPDPRPLFGLDLLAQRPGDKVMVVEGEEAAVAGECFPEYVVVTSMSGSMSAAKADWGPLAGRDVTIWPDNDGPGAAYAADVAGSIRKAGARSVRIVDLPPDLPRAWNIADEMPPGLSHADLVALLTVETPVPPQSPTLPQGFRMLDRGLVWSDPADPDKPEILVAGRFEVIAESRDDEGRNWGVLLRWQDQDGRVREWAMPRQLLAGDGVDVRRVLLDGGLYVGPGVKARNLLTMFLASIHVDQRARAVSTTGWYGKSFVLPDETIGNISGERVILQTVGALDHAFGTRGTLAGWQDGLARYAVGNSRLALAISIAMAAVLVRPAGEESGGIHFRGPSSIGKSTALVAAASAWGGDSRRYVRQWRATANGLEAVAASHNDSLLCLDELSQISGREAAEVGYMLANGSGKARASRDATLRRAASWQLLFLSSGEISLGDKIGEDGRGKRQTAGQQVRVVDVPADTGSGYGLFENLHGFHNPGALAKYLVTAANENYGTAIRAFIEQIAPDIKDIGASIRVSIQDFVDDQCADNADGQVKRVACRFGLIAAAGEIAINLGILPWPVGEAIRAARACFAAWLEARGGTESAEVRDGIAAVRRFLSAHATSRFHPAWDDTAQLSRTVDLAGFRRRVGNGPDAPHDFFVTTEAWPSVCAGFDPKAVAAALAERGFLHSDNGPHRAKKMRVPGYDQRRVYHVSHTIFGDGIA